MFGYVRPRRDLLGQAEQEDYQAAYCGLCRALGKHYGFAARFLVNYDMTFLYLLRASAGASAQTAPCWCPARVCGKKNCVLDPQGLSSVAAYTVILCVEKLRDNIRDERFFRTLPHRLMALIYHRAYRKAARVQPGFAALTASQLQALHELEAAQSPSIDATADAFARIVAGCAGDSAPALRRPMEQVLYQTGRFLYLTDALDDLREDCARGAYNPLRFRFSVREGEMTPDDLAYLSQLTDSSVNLAGAALSLLPAGAHTTVLENIVFMGLPSVFSAVKAGRFQAGKRMWGRGQQQKNDENPKAR